MTNAEKFKGEPTKTDLISKEEALMALTGINLPTDRDKLIALFDKRIKALQTVEAVPLSVKEALEEEIDSFSQAYKEEHEKWKSLMLAIEKKKAEIIQYFMQNKDSEDLFLAGCGDGAYHALAIIDKAVKECTHE